MEREELICGTAFILALTLLMRADARFVPVLLWCVKAPDSPGGLVTLRYRLLPVSACGLWSFVSLSQLFWNRDSISEKVLLVSVRVFRGGGGVP